MVFVGLLGDAKNMTLRCAVISVEGVDQRHVLAKSQSAAPGALAVALENWAAGGETGLDTLGRMHAMAGEWIGALARSTLDEASLNPQTVELVGCAGLRFDGGLALGDLGLAARESGLIFTPVSVSPSASAEDCAAAAWELWRSARQDTPAGAGVHALTEGRNPATTEIDRLPTLDMLRLINVEDTRVPRAVGSQLAQIAEAVDRIAERMRRGGRMIYAGAGTSGRMGVLDASEVPPTYGTAQELVVALIAGGDIAVYSSLEGVEDDTAAGLRAVQDLATGADDTLIGIAASGRTPYVMAAMEEARRRGALVISLACNSPSPMEALADIVIAPLVGPEVITGSTRMKAGTAQKLVLNMLSTCVMVRLGKTYSNLMVDMQATNIKLRGRARRIITEVTGMDDQAAGQILNAAGGELKTAIVMAKTGVTAGAARERLARSSGGVRAALETPAADDDGR